MPTFNVPDVGTDHESEAQSVRSESDVEIQDRPEETNETMATQTPTLEQAVNEIRALKEEIALLKTKKKEKGKILRPKRPEPYDGDPRKMDKYFTELDIYFGYFPDTLEYDEDKTILAITCLTGAAEEWARPIMKDYEQNDTDKQKQQTQDIFEKHTEFRNQLKKSFGSTNEEQEAERDLRNLMQKGPLSKHTTTFIRLLTKVNWTEDSKKEFYYQSLKPKVKDEMYRVKRKDVTFIDFTQQCIDADNRIWEREQEKKHEKTGRFHTPQYKHNNANQGRKRDLASSNDGKPGPMDLDTINTRKFTGKCNHCGKVGHKERNCWDKNGKPNNLRENKKTEKTEKVRIDTIDTVPHNLLSWTACYDDQCLIHKDGKEGSGWFPKAPKKKQPKKVTIATMTFEEYKEKREEADALATASEFTEEEKERESRILFELGERSQEPTGYTDLDISDPCERCGSREPQGPNHPCGWDNSDNDEDLIKEEPEGELQRLLSHEGIIRRQAPKNDRLAERTNANPYYPILTRDQFLEWEEAQLMRDTPFTENCGHSSTHQCNNRLCIEHWETKIIDWHSWIQHGNLYDRNCTHADPEQCPNRLCNQHVEYKVEEWHTRRETIACKKRHPLQCYNDECLKHQKEKEEYKNLRRRLRKQGFNFENHDKGHAYRKDIIRFHEFHLEEITTHKCQWCRKVTKTNQIKQWWDNDLDAIHEDALTYNITKEDREKIHVDTVKTIGMKKLRIDAQLSNSAITAYIDSGSDRNLISTQAIKKLQIPVQRKARALQIMSVMGTEVGDGLIEYETDHLPLTINGRTHTVQFSVLDMPNCDILLGYPWLIDNDPIIRWKTNQVCWDIKDVPEY